ncbi:C-type lectin 37Db-like [Drosophila busckii]|uniref:C-type lectin 37Db-like n=1 Tax=Drosophila busckii TaxID=30019 RepID=UPI001432D8B5|nr:C-type lectin 37Db-like [Drosophila busckii]
MYRLLCFFVIISLYLGIKAGTSILDTGDIEHCPPYFSRVGPKCYHVSLEKVNWFVADRRCKAMNATLMVFENETDREHTTDLLIKRGVPFNNDWRDAVWIGGNTLGLPRHFVRSHDGGALPFTPWLPGEPSNKNEECIDYYRVPSSQKFGYNDTPCLSSQVFVCQTQILISTAFNCLNVLSL